MPSLSKFWLDHSWVLIYSRPMNSIELSQFTLREKFQIMQSIWEEMRGTVDNLKIPQSHARLLDERRRRVESGEAKLRDWDEVKHTIGRR